MSQSTRSHRMLKQLGSGSSANLCSALPVPAHSLPVASTLTREAKKRLAWFDYARTHSVSQTCRHFGIARSLFYYWRPRYDPRDLSKLEARSSHPRRVRQRAWTAAQIEAVRHAREQYPRWGKQKLAVVLARRGVHLCVSTIGRMLHDLKRRGLLIEPRRVRTSPHARHPRPHAQRKPKGAALPRDVPGALIEVDTMRLYPAPGVVRYQFTAVDVASRYGVVGVRGAATARTAREFLMEARARFPFDIKAIQIDGGSEFMAEFEQECQNAWTPLWVLPPHSPKLNGHVERANRTHREAGALWAAWECYEGDLDLPTISTALRTWEDVYNGERPHHALGLRTPAQFLADWHLSKRS